MNEAGGVVEANRLDEAAAGGVVRREELLQVSQRDPGLGRRFPGTEGRIGKAIPTMSQTRLNSLVAAPETNVRSGATNSAPSRS